MAASGKTAAQRWKFVQNNLKTKYPARFKSCKFTYEEESPCVGGGDGGGNGGGSSSAGGIEVVSKHNKIVKSSIIHTSFGNLSK